MKYSIVIPTKNEEETLRGVLKNIVGLTDDVFIVDGHSVDRTLEIAKEFNVKYYLDNKLGKGDAIRLSLTKSKYPITVFIDADGSHDHNDIVKLVKPIHEDKFDLVIASRMLGGSDELFGTFSEVIRLIGSLVISLSINYRFGIRLTDYQNGFRAIRTEVGKSINLKSNSTTIEQEMAMKCFHNNFRVGEVPSHEYKRKGGVSKISVWKVSHIYIWSLLRGIFTIRKKTKIN